MMAGAHPKTQLKAPSIALASRLIAAASGHVAIVTVAPELPGALPLIRHLARRGVRVQLGHSMATGKTALAAANAGAAGLTHLYNAMRIHHREPSLLTPLISGRFKSFTAEIITDGVHLAPDFIGWLLSAAPDRLYAVSDGCSAVCARAGARLTLGSLRLRRDGPVAVVAGNGILAGGATALTAHPARLHKALGHFSPADQLALYFATQRTLFPQAAKRARLKNHFDGSTLRFLGCEHS